jgi:LacI family transcriptional regulator
MLQNHSPTSFLNEHLQHQEYLREHSYQSLIDFHIDTIPSCFRGNPEKALELYIRSHPANLWILYQSTAPMQWWFKKRNLPCILLGSCYEGIDFCSVDEDYRASARHAAGLFLNRGHRSLALLTSEISLAGDKASREGFESIAQSSRYNDITYYVGFHNGTTNHICKITNWLLSRPKVPTAWFIHNSQTYFTVLSHLAQRQVFVGKDLSIICRNSDPYFDYLIPTVAHYSRNLPRMNRVLFKLVQQCLHGEFNGKQQYRIISNFHDGKSLSKM